MINLEALKKEAVALAAEHPSKDCRFFAAQIPEVIDLLHEMADALVDCDKHVDCGRMLARDALVKYREMAK
jgi:hypothetical protein